MVYFPEKKLSMKVIVCDVGDAACAFVSSANGKTMMIDCGCSLGPDKTNPVDIFYKCKNWLGSRYFTDYSKGQTYPITLLHITHPDDDHVRNARRVVNDLTPCLVLKNDYELFPDGNEINSDYKELIDKQYRGQNITSIDLGFDIDITCHIPVITCISNQTLNSKVRNNSSIIRYIYDNGVGILFCGDLERPGWDYLVRNNPNFINTLRSHGVKILVAPHHGHKSGFPKALFDAIGNVDIVIHSKDTEASKDGTDVSSQYSSMANGHSYYVGNSIYSGKVLTTRSNGHVFIETTGYCNYAIYACTASSNHQRLY